MKILNVFLLFGMLLTLGACHSSDPSTTENKDSSGAVCIWDNASLKETPEDNGKWLCAISIGEIVNYQDSEKEVNNGKKTVKYLKVKLKDGKEGWVQSDFIVLNSKPAAITEDVEIYSRPDLLNKTKKLFNKMDIVAVKSENGDFIEVTGKRKTGKWIESGWLKTRSLSYSQEDIAVAKFANKAFEIKDPVQREKAIKEIIDNADLKGSVFISALSKPEVKMEEKTDSIN